MPKLTKRTVEAARSSARDVLVWDSQLRGFGLRVFPSGRRAFVVKYRAGARQRWLRLGFFGAAG
jgi:hypothetical protein